MIVRLVVANALARPVRAVLTVLAVALAVSLVVSTTSGYASLRATAVRFITQFNGAFDVRFYAVDPRGANVTPALQASIARDADVALVAPRIEVDRPLIGPGSAFGNPRPYFLIGLDPAADDAPVQLKPVAGRWFTSASADECVLDDAARGRLGATLDGEIVLPGPKGNRTLRVVGIVAKPGAVSFVTQTMYLPIETLRAVAFPEGKTYATQLNVRLRDGKTEAKFLERWRGEVRGLTPKVAVDPMRRNREQLDRQLGGLNLLSYVAGSATMASAAFIIFSTLSMGVIERQRVLAMMRAIGAGRGQIARLVVVEAIALCTIGVILGVPLGLGFLQILISMFPDFFQAGTAIDWSGVAFAGGVALVASVVASLLPAWKASRVDPLAAMSPLASPDASGPPLAWAAVGLVVASIDPLTMFLPWTRWIAGDWVRDARFYTHFFVGLPGVFLGAFLIAPTVAWLLDKFATPVVAKVFWVPAKLLRDQLGGALWRAAGTASAIMVGLATLFVLQSQGQSGLGAWKLPTRFPDVLIYSPVGGIDEPMLDQIAKLDGIRGGRRAMIPLGIFVPQFARSPFGLAGIAFAPNATTFIAADPGKLLEAIEFDFRAGDAATARALLEQGGYILVTEELARVSKLGVGDTLTLKNPDGYDVPMKIAGVVWSPGMDVLIASFDMRKQFEQRTAACVFGTPTDASRLFGKDRYEMVAVRVASGVSKQDLVYSLQEKLGSQGLLVSDARRIKNEIVKQVGQLLLLGNSVAWCALLVAMLGVTNTIVASVRTRQWQLGVLRAVGITRGVLLRLVLAEGLLLGLTGVFLGSMAGMTLSLDAWRFYDVVLGFRPPLIIPWPTLLLAAAATLLAAVLACVAPAIRVARADLLSLLQAGRSAA